MDSKRHVTTSCSPQAKDALQRAADSINEARDAAGTAAEHGRETISGLLNALVERHLAAHVAAEVDAALRRIAERADRIRAAAGN